MKEQKEEGRGDTQEGDEEEEEEINGEGETQKEEEEEEEEDGWELETALGASPISFDTFSSSIRNSEGSSSSSSSSSNSSSQISSPSSQDSNTSDYDNDDDDSMDLLPKLTSRRPDCIYCSKNVRLWQFAIQNGMDLLKAVHYLDRSPYHEGKRCKHCYGKTEILEPDDPDYYDFEGEREAERLKSEKAAGQQQSYW